MATYVTLTVPVADIIGADYDPRRTAAFIEANTPNSLIIVDSTSIRVGGTRETPDDNGDIIFPNLVATNSADNPTTGLEYIITLVYTPKGSRKGKPDTITTSSFPLTATANLASIEEAWDNITAPPSWRSDFLDQAGALLDQQEAISGLTGEDAAIANRVNTPGSATDAALAAKYARKGELHIDSFPRLGGETHDSPRITRAIAAAVAAGLKRIRFADATYTLNSTVTVSDPSIQLVGNGWGTIFTNATNTTMFEITGNYFILTECQVQATDASRTNYPVRVTGPLSPLIRKVRFSGITGSWRAGLWLNGGSMASVVECTFSHACIRVSTWDVKIDRCYVWGMTCEFAIAILDGAGNTTISNTDIVPPLRSTVGATAGILVGGGVGNPFSTKIVNVYLDGNPSLDTREGIYIGNGAAGTILSNINANCMDSDAIVIDSAYNIVIDGYTGHTNNMQGNGARDIVVRQTGAQPAEKIRITNVQCLRTTAVTGLAGPAIEVDAAVAAGQVQISNVDIKQPGGGGGYANPEIKVGTSGGYPAQSISTCNGQLSKYQAIGSQAVASGATFATINLSTPFPMAYRPTPAQLQFMFEGASGQIGRVAYASDNQITVTFVAATTAAATLHWRADLRR